MDSSKNVTSSTTTLKQSIDTLPLLIDTDPSMPGQKTLGGGFHRKGRVRLKKLEFLT